MNPKKSFGAYVRHLRESAGLTQSQVAEKVGGNREGGSLSRIERERGYTDALETVASIGQAFGLSSGQLVDQWERWRDAR